MKKRLLQLIGSFHLGGSERQAVALTRMIKADGTFEVYAATLNNDGVLKPEIDALGLPEIQEFPLTSFFNANFVKQVRRFSRYLKENEIDLIHTHDFYTNVFGMAAATLAGVKARVASKRETGGMRSASQQLVERAAFGRAHAIVANSQSVKDFLTERSIPGRKLHVIYNGIDAGKYDPSPSASTGRESFGLPVSDNVHLVTLVANLRHDVKNVPMLLRAAKTVAAETTAVHFVIAGEGELRSALEAMAAVLGIADIVHFIGRCDDVPGLLAVSDVCVLTSQAEGFSNSVLEYMAAGKPVIATNVGGAAEAVVEGETGYLVESDDDKTLAQRITELVNDREKSAAFGKKGREIVTGKFSREEQLRRTVELYNSLLR